MSHQSRRERTACRLLAAARWVDAGEGEEVDHLEVAAVAAGKGWPPVGLAREVGVRVGFEQSDQDLADDPPADGAEVFAAGHELRFAEHVVPEWRLPLEPGVVFA